MEPCSQSLSQLNITPLLPNNPHRFHIIVIGAGSIVNICHLPAYNLANFTVKGIYDVDKKRAQETANKWNIPIVFDTLKEACTFTSDKNIIFDLAVPSKEILSILQQLPINSYVLIQKPMGESLEEAQVIVDLCEQHHIHASINFQLRYAPYILALKDAIHRGWLGDKITTIEIHVNVLMPWLSWPFLASVPRLELTYHSIHYVDLVRDLVSPYEPTSLHCRTSRHAAMSELSPVRSSLSFEFEHDPFLYANIYTNHHHRWGQKHVQSYLLVEGTGGAAKAQIGDNLFSKGNPEGKQTDYLQVIIIHIFLKFLLIYNYQVYLINLFVFIFADLFG
jgi:predicted dehydrogenase